MINIHLLCYLSIQGYTPTSVLLMRKTKSMAPVSAVTEELDGGPVILQAKVPVFEGDDADMLASRVLTQEPAFTLWSASGSRKIVYQ